jgi:hypothetical protein
VCVLVLGGSASWSVGASSSKATVHGALQRLVTERDGRNCRLMRGAFLGFGAWLEMTALTNFLEDVDRASSSAWPAVST